MRRAKHRAREASTEPPTVIGGEVDLVIHTGDIFDRLQRSRRR